MRFSFSFLKYYSENHLMCPNITFRSTFSLWPCTKDIFFMLKALCVVVIFCLAEFALRRKASNKNSIKTSVFAKNLFLFESSTKFVFATIVNRNNEQKEFHLVDEWENTFYYSWRVQAILCEKNVFIELSVLIRETRPRR